MPRYEFYCSDCKKEFELALTVGDYEKHEWTCPYCQKKNLERVVTTPHVITTKKS